MRNSHDGLRASSISLELLALFIRRMRHRDFEHVQNNSVFAF